MNDIDVELLRADLAARLERWKAEDTRLMESWRSDATARLEDSRSANAYAQAALKAVMLINGAGAAALLAFLGSKGPTVPLAVSKIVVGCGVLILGVALSAVAFAIAPMVMMLFIRGKDSDVHQAKQLRVAAFACAFASIACFVIGCGIAALAIGS